MHDLKSPRLKAITSHDFLKIRDIFEEFQTRFVGKCFISSVASILLVFEYVSQFYQALSVPEKWTI